MAALLLSSAAAAQARIAPAKAADRKGAERVAQRWQSELETIDVLLSESAFKKAYRRASGLLEETNERLISGAAAELLLAKVMAQKALAAHGLGDEREAAWYWYGALALFPATADFRVEVYGDAGRYLKSLDHREPQALEDSSKVPNIAQIDPGSMQRLRGRVPQWPEAQQGREVGTAIIEVIVDEQGLPTLPLLLESSGPATFVSAVLDAMSSWRFRPGTLDGRPVSVASRHVIRFE